MNIGIYGGSFNPIHFGHIGLVQWVVENTDLDEIWLMVSPNNPLKDNSILADEKVRLHEAEKTIKNIGKNTIFVSDFEFTLPRPSYTANTLRELSKQYPNHQFTLVIGEDNLNIFTQWREYEYILTNYHVLVYPRKGCEQTAEEMISKLHIKNIKGIQILHDAPHFEISSTELRKNLHN